MLELIAGHHDHLVHLPIPVVDFIRVAMQIATVVVVVELLRRAAAYKRAFGRPAYLNLSVVIFMVVQFFDRLGRFGDPMSWRLPFRAMGIALAVVFLVKTSPPPVPVRRPAE